jgi:hypothetical protein
MSARTKVEKNDRVSAIDAIEAPTPPAPITKIFITHQFFMHKTRLFYAVLTKNRLSAND